MILRVTIINPILSLEKTFLNFLFVLQLGQNKVMRALIRLSPSVMSDISGSCGLVISSLLAIGILNPLNLNNFYESKLNYRI